MTVVAEPLEKLITDAVGRGWSEGHTVRKPVPAACVTVTVTEIAAAPVGTPHLPTVGIVSVAPAAIAVPATRVSCRRQGANATNEVVGSPGAALAIGDCATLKDIAMVAAATQTGPSRKALGMRETPVGRATRSYRLRTLTA